MMLLATLPLVSSLWLTTLPGPGGAREPVQDGLVSDFESGRPDTAFGSGWSISTDSFLGGASSAEMNVVPGGAGDSEHCLEIYGEVVASASQPWAGVMFSPGATPMAPVDLSRFDTVTFRTRGDGGTYATLLIVQSRGFSPLVQTFQASEEWTEQAIRIADFGDTDGSDIMSLQFTSGRPGEFAFEIDDVRFESRGGSGAGEPGIDNLVHAEGTRTAPLGTLGRVELLGHGPTPLVMIPGFGFTADVFRELAERNRERYTMVLVTPAGFGSPPPPMPSRAESTSYADRTWCRAYEEALWRLVRTLGLEDPILVAHSDGLQHAVRVAAAHPGEVAAIVTIAGEPVRDLDASIAATAEEASADTGPEPTRARFIDERMAAGWFRSVTEETWRNGMGQPAWYSADEATGEAHYAATLVPSIPTMVRYYCEKWSHDARPALRALEVPVLALLPDAAELPDDTNYQAFLAMALVDPWTSLADLPHVTTVPMAGARLGLLADDLDGVSARLNAFVRGLE